MRRRQAPAGALPTELMVLVVIDVVRLAALCTLKTEQRGDKEDLSLLFLRTCRLSPRAISTGQLHALLHFHLRPINQVVFLGPYPLEEVRDLILGGVSRLDAFSVYLVHT